MLSTRSNRWRWAAVALAALLCACGQEKQSSNDQSKSGASRQSEFAGLWQAGGSFPGDCTDLQCPAQYSFRLSISDAGACVWKGQTRRYRVNPENGEWDYEDWHTYAPTQGACTWKARDAWHMTMSLHGSTGTWAGQLNGSVLEVTGPALAGLRIHFSRLDQ